MQNSCLVVYKFLMGHKKEVSRSPKCISRSLNRHIPLLFKTPNIVHFGVATGGKRFNGLPCVASGNVIDGSVESNH